MFAILRDYKWEWLLLHLFFLFFGTDTNVLSWLHQCVFQGQLFKLSFLTFWNVLHDLRLPSFSQTALFAADLVPIPAPRLDSCAVANPRFLILCVFCMRAGILDRPPEGQHCDLDRAVSHSGDHVPRLGLPPRGHSQLQRRGAQTHNCTQVGKAAWISSHSVVSPLKSWLLLLILTEVLLYCCPLLDVPDFNIFCVFCD